MIPHLPAPCEFVQLKLLNCRDRRSGRDSASRLIFMTIGPIEKSADCGDHEKID